MSEFGDISGAVKAGAEAADIATRTGKCQHGGDEVPVVLLADGQKLAVPTEALDLLEARAPAPRRRIGTARHDEIQSFCDHVNRFKSEHSAVFASAEHVRLDAVLDYHPADGSAWCSHRSIYTCPLSDPWKAWTGGHGEAMSQDDFAAFVDDHLDDLIAGDGYPAPAKVLEMARDLAVHTKGTFERRVHPTTGDFVHVCKQETSSESTQIPRAFLLALPVFVGGELFKVEAKIRFRVRGGNASFSYELHRHTEVLRAAFADVRAKVALACELPVFAGTPE